MVRIMLRRRRRAFGFRLVAVRAMHRMAIPRLIWLSCGCIRRHRRNVVHRTVVRGNQIHRQRDEPDPEARRAEAPPNAERAENPEHTPS